MSETIRTDGPTPYEGEYPVESNRRLLSRDLDPQLGLREYYDARLGSRVVSMVIGSEQARSHEELTEEKMPVFSSMYWGGKLILQVPDGTRPVSKLLRFIARDLPNYGDVFYQIGRALHQTQVANFGLPDPQPNRSVLEQYAFVLDDDDEYGGKIYLSPPYSLNPNKTIGQIINGISMELTDSSLLSEHEVAELMQKTVMGWGETGNDK